MFKFKFIPHFIDLVNEIKKVNINFTKGNTLTEQLLQSQKETNEKLDTVANLERDFLTTLTHFVAIREKHMNEEAKREALREVEAKPTKDDYLF